MRPLPPATISVTSPLWLVAVAVPYRLHASATYLLSGYRCSSRQNYLPHPAHRLCLTWRGITVSNRFLSVVPLPSHIRCSTPYGRQGLIPRTLSADLPVLTDLDNCPHIVCPLVGCYTITRFLLLPKTEF